MLLSTYCYYKILVMCPVWCNASLSPSYDQQLAPLKSPPRLCSRLPTLVTTSLSSVSVRLLPFSATVTSLFVSVPLHLARAL